MHNWALQHLLKQPEQPAYMGCLHGDMLLANPFDARPYLDVRGVYGSPATYNASFEETCWHLHPQMLFLRLGCWTAATVRGLDFAPRL